MRYKWRELWMVGLFPRRPHNPEPPRTIFGFDILKLLGLSIVKNVHGKPFPRIIDLVFEAQFHEAL